MSDTLPNKYDDMTDAEIIKARDKMMNNLVVVLNDGETYTSLSGCVILEVPQEVMDDEVIAAIQGGLETAKEKGVTLNAEQEAFIEDPEQDADVKRMRENVDG